jgi:alkanesulfonate monooxygenase SsuD/methylene tetrahydromethanopterin reductase-like flavin-dependent oxidoreductase (luciferase family)
MNVVSLTFRDPVLLAKQCATIDVLSEGRLLPAFGIGSPMAPEWEALGVDTKTRGRKTDECLEIIRRLWRVGRLRWRLLQTEGRRHHAKAGAA